MPSRSFALTAALLALTLGCTDDGGSDESTETDASESESGDTTSDDEIGSESETSEDTTDESESSEDTTDAESESSEDTTDEESESTQDTGECDPASGDGVATDVTLETADGKSIAATVTVPEQGNCLPAVLLIHQFNLSKSQWDGHVDSFIARGYVTMAIDLRGHGQSDAQDGSLVEILNDPDQAPLDVEAALAHLLAVAEVDPERVGIVGTSVGANLAVVGASQSPDVALAVPLSARQSPVTNLLGGDPVDVGPLLCYAGELDGGGDQAATCGWLEGLANGPTQSVILPGTAAHGVAIVDMFPDTIPDILDFLDTNL